MLNSMVTGYDAHNVYTKCEAIHFVNHTNKDSMKCGVLLCDQECNSNFACSTSRLKELQGQTFDAEYQCPFRNGRQDSNIPLEEAETGDIIVTAWRMSGGGLLYAVDDNGYPATISLSVNYRQDGGYKPFEHTTEADRQAAHQAKLCSCGNYNKTGKTGGLCNTCTSKKSASKKQKVEVIDLS